MATYPLSLTNNWAQVLPRVDFPFAVTKKVSVKNWLLIYCSESSNHW